MKIRGEGRGVVGVRGSVWMAVAAIVSAGLVAACGGQAPAETGALEHTGVSDAGFTAPLTDASIYDLDLPLVDADGRASALADLRGRTIVAGMVYTSCTSVCPRVTEEMKAVERLLPADVKARVTFALFSLDPGRDTPMALKRFGAEHALDPARWRLLAASEDGVRDLSAVFGVKYRREANGEIAHSAMIFVIDPTGVVRHRQVGLAEDSSPLVRAVTSAGA